MILSNKYKKAMDNISLTDEQKKRIVQNAKKTRFDFRVIVNTAACIAVLIVAVGILNNQFEPNSPDKYQNDSVAVETVTEYSTEGENNAEMTTELIVEKTTEITTEKIEKKNSVVYSHNEKNATDKEKKIEKKQVNVEHKDVENIEKKTEKSTESFVKEETQKITDESDEAFTVESSGENLSIPKINDNSYYESSAQFEYFESINDLKKAIDFNVKIPYNVSKYSPVQYAIMFGSTVEIEYSDGINNFFFRTGKGSDDISGDYNQYDVVEKFSVIGFNITAKGRNNGFNNAIWNNDGMTYSITSENGLTKAEIENIVKGLK